MIVASAAANTAALLARGASAAVRLTAAKLNRERRKKKSTRGKMRTFKKKAAKNKKKKAKQTKSTKRLKGKRSKRPQKSRKPKRRTPVQSRNRKTAKTRLRTRQSKYDEEKQSIRSNTRLTEEEKTQRLASTRARYSNAQRRTIQNYRQRKSALNYAGRSYYASSLYPYGGVAAGLLVGGLAGALITRTAIGAPPPMYGMPGPSGPAYGAPMMYPPGNRSLPPPGQQPGNSQSSSRDSDEPEELDEQKKTPEETPQEKPFPFNEQELRTLAHHNTVAGRSVKSLENLKGSHLVAFLNARDEYMSEKDPDAQLTKGLRLMSVSKQLDKRYNTHAMAWGRVMKYRPGAWTREMAQYFADGADANEMDKISKMSGPEVTKYLEDMDPEKLQGIQQTSEAEATQTISCSMDEHMDERATRSDLFNQFAVYFENERKEIVFHLNGFIEITSFVSERESQRYGIDRVIKVLGKNAVVKNDIKTKCEHLQLFANVRMLNRMLTIFPHAMRGHVTIDNLVKEKESFATPDNEIPRMWFGTNIMKTEFLPLAPFVLSTNQKMELSLSDNDLKTTNDLITAITAIVAPSVTLFAKEFPTLVPPPQLKRNIRVLSETPRAKKSRT
jgi:hypothetical protein